MLLFNIYKNACRSTVLQLGKITGSQKYRMAQVYQLHRNTKLLTNLRVITNSLVPQRFYSANQNDQDSLLLHPLTDDPISMVPKILKLVSNAYNLHSVITGRLDKEFDVDEFVEGSKQAVEYVSTAIARDDFDSLVGLVANEVIEKLKTGVSKLSQAQKELIPIRKDDIYSSIHSEIDVVYEGDKDNQRTFAVITMIYFSLRGLAEMKVKGDMPPAYLGLMPEYQNKLYVCNYRFRRDYTNSTSEPWIVTMCNESMIAAVN